MSEEKIITNPVKAIRAKCLDCVCGNPVEVKLCPSEDCALHPFRLGKNPYRSNKREYTDEQLMILRERMAKARQRKQADNKSREEMDDEG